MENCACEASSLMLQDRPHFPPHASRAEDKTFGGNFYAVCLLHILYYETVRQSGQPVVVFTRTGRGMQREGGASSILRTIASCCSTSVVADARRRMPS